MDIVEIFQLLAVSVLFNEPKLLKLAAAARIASLPKSFSALQRAEIAETARRRAPVRRQRRVSVLFNEPKLLKLSISFADFLDFLVSVLFNEPKLLKTGGTARKTDAFPFQCSSTSRNC